MPDTTDCDDHAGDRPAEAHGLAGSALRQAASARHNMPDQAGARPEPALRAAAARAFLERAARSFRPPPG